MFDPRPDASPATLIFAITIISLAAIVLIAQAML